MISPVRLLRSALRSQLRKNIFSGLMFSGVNNLMALIALPIYLHYLGTETYGLWVTVAVIIEFSQFGQFGMDTAAIKYTAQEVGRGDRSAVTAILSSALAALMVPITVGVAALWLLRYPIASFIRLQGPALRTGIPLIVAVGALSGLGFFMQVMRGVVVGLGRLDTANYTLLAGRILRICVAVALLALGFGLWSIYISWIVNYLMPLAVWARTLRARFGVRAFDPRRVEPRRIRDLLRLGGTLTVAQVAHVFMDPFNKVVLARYVGLDAVVYYQAAYNLVIAARGLFIQGLEALLPALAETHARARGALASVLAIRRKGLLFIWGFAVPVFAAIILVADPLLRFWLRANFAPPIVPTLRILALGWMANAIAVPDYYLYIAIGRARVSVTATVLKSLANVLAIVTLVSTGLGLSLARVATVDAASLGVAVLFLKAKSWSLRRGGVPGVPAEPPRFAAAAGGEEAGSGSGPSPALREAAESPSGTA